MAIQLWEVYHVTSCRHAIPPNDKFVVVACFDPTPYGFFINSRINPYWQRRGLLPCHAAIYQTEHRFLAHNSFVDCTSIYEYTNMELTHRVGVLSAQARIDVKGSVRACRVLTRHYKDLIITTS